MWGDLVRLRGVSSGVCSGKQLDYPASHSAEALTPLMWPIHRSRWLSHGMAVGFSLQGVI